jgi:hypothetical protein
LEHPIFIPLKDFAKENIRYHFKSYILINSVLFSQQEAKLSLIRELSSFSERIFGVFVQNVILGEIVIIHRVFGKAITRYLSMKHIYEHEKMQKYEKGEGGYRLNLVLGQTIF